MGAGRMRFMRGPSLTYASVTNNWSTSTSFERFSALAMAERRTFSTIGAIRLLTERRMLMAVPAFWPRIMSTTSRTFCGDVRTYLASALCIQISLASLSRWGWVVGSGRWEKLLALDTVDAHILAPINHILYDGFAVFSVAAGAPPGAPPVVGAAAAFTEWPRNWRVGENSPSLRPTMFSVMYTGINFLPL